MSTSQRGFTMVENLVAMVVIVIVTTALTSYLTYMKRTTEEIKVLSSEDKHVLDIIENIRTGLAHRQINFNVRSTTYDPLQTLPANNKWGKGIEGQNYGYSIQRGIYPGLYEVTLKLAHPNWSNPKTYQFVVGVR